MGRELMLISAQAIPAHQEQADHAHRAEHRQPGQRGSQHIRRQDKHHSDQNA